MSSTLIVFRYFGNQRFCRQKQAGDRRSIQKGGSCHHGGINDTGRNQILVLLGLGIETKVGILALGDLSQHYRAFLTRVLDNLTQRLFECPSENIDTDLLVCIFQLELIKS